MSKKIFEDLAPAQRIEALKENAYEVCEQNVRRDFTPDEMSKMKDDLTEETILRIDAEEELKELSAPLKETIKEKKEVIKSLSNKLRDGYYENFESVYRMSNHETQMMDVYDYHGVLLYSVPMTQKERQYKLRAVNE